MFWQGLLGVGVGVLIFLVFNFLLAAFCVDIFEEKLGGCIIVIVEAISVVWICHKFQNLLPCVTMIVTLFLLLVECIYFSHHEYLGSLWNIIFVTAVLLVIINLGISEIFKYESNFVVIETPEIVETRYEIISDNENTKVSEYLEGYFTYTEGQTSETSYYSFFYLAKNEEDEDVAIPYSTRLCDTEIVLLLESEESSEYLLISEAKYYVENRNKNPIERILDRTETYYKLYIRPSTFYKMRIDSDK